MKVNESVDTVIEAVQGNLVRFSRVYEKQTHDVNFSCFESAYLYVTVTLQTVKKNAMDN